MKYTDIKEMGTDELVKKRKEIVEGLFQARMKNHLGQLGNPLEIRQLRRDRARIETALTQKRNKA